VFLNNSSYLLNIAFSIIFKNLGETKSDVSHFGTPLLINFKILNGKLNILLSLYNKDRFSFFFLFLASLLFSSSSTSISVLKNARSVFNLLVNPIVFIDYIIESVSLLICSFSSLLFSLSLFYLISDVT
jgi:hypothetical protein